MTIDEIKAQVAKLQGWSLDPCTGWYRNEKLGHCRHSAYGCPSPSHVGEIVINWPKNWEWFKPCELHDGSIDPDLKGKPYWMAWTLHPKKAKTISSVYRLDTGDEYFDRMSLLLGVLENEAGFNA